MAVTVSSSLVVVYLDGASILSASIFSIDMASLGVSRAVIGCSYNALFSNIQLKDFKVYDTAVRYIISARFA